MGEKKRRSESHAALLRRHPYCIFCGGEKRATTIEHTPPRIMFRRKDRPNELIFPACDSCNKGTSHADMVAAMIGRLSVPSDPQDHIDFTKILEGIRNNIPELLKEMRLSGAARKFAFKDVGLDPNSGFGVLKANGPLLTSYMEAFIFKFAIALYFSRFEKPLTPDFMIKPFWYSNVELMSDAIPDTIRKVLPDPQTLSQGRKNVSDQFLYASNFDEDGNYGIVFATFRSAFGAGALITNDVSDLAGDFGGGYFYHPGELPRILQRTRGRS